MTGILSGRLNLGYREPVLAALFAAAMSAVSYGVASVLEAIGARRTPASATVDPRLLARVSRQAPFLAGLGLDTVGFAAQFFALRTLPVFVVQAAIAANLAVTAVAAIPMLGLRLTSRQWTAIACVCGGLAMLGFSSGAEHPQPVSLAFRFGLLACLVLLALVGIAGNRMRGPAQATTLGLVAGLSFGVVALAARSITDLHIFALLRDPSTYALIAGGAIAFQFFTIGLQRASVTAVTGSVVVTETVLPAIVGVLVFGDNTRHGLLPLAVVGFLLAVGGSLALARYGDPTAEQASFTQH
jgi:drug/metabolite transporter (DMT)-like permease